MLSSLSLNRIIRSSFFCSVKITSTNLLLTSPNKVLLVSSTLITERSTYYMHLVALASKVDVITSCFGALAPGDSV